ncbi:uncharacterized protein [Polyergus mexicanus]|uniref:uncharacterized protein n=1 Tax=Polyergus mexicanus TaxID=615972 RepID=UPI0038B49938
MSKKICRSDQYKLNQILEQVKALSDVVDELRMALNDLKKASVNREIVFFEPIKENNKVDYVKPTVLRNMKTYFSNTGICTRIDETHQIAKNTEIHVIYLLKKLQFIFLHQLKCISIFLHKFISFHAWKSCSTSPNYVVHCKRKRDHKPSEHTIRSLTTYSSLKFFKNKIIKNIQSFRKTRQSPKSTEHQCVTNQQQLQIYVLQKEEKQKFFEDTKNEDITKNTDINEELSNAADTSLSSDAFAQTEIAICSWQENEGRLLNLPCRNVIENSTQASPLSMISDRSVIHSDRFTGELPKNHTKRMFLANKIKKYKKCLCREQCPYALYKLPCNKYKCSTSEKKVDDEINELTHKCSSYQKKNNFPRFVNVDTAREKNDERFADFSPVKIRVDESSTSSLSMDLEVKICNDHRNSENIDEFSKRRRARTYIVNKKNTMKNDVIKNFRNETESSFNIISLWRHINEKKEKIDEIIENILSQRKYINPEKNHQGNQNYNTENFIDDHWSLKNKNKQVQCAISALATPILNEKISVKTLNPKFQQSDSLDQSCRRTNRTRYTNFPKTITQRWMKTNMQTQTRKCFYFNHLENRSSLLADYANLRNMSKMYANGAKKTREDVTARSKGFLNQICDKDEDWRNWRSVKASCPFCYNHISAEKHKILMPYLTNYSILHLKH